MEYHVAKILIFSKSANKNGRKNGGFSYLQSIPPKYAQNL